MDGFRYLIRSICLLALISVTGSATPPKQQVPTIQTMKTTVDNHKLNYLLFKPLKSEVKQPRPLLIFLHGAGERGTDMSLALRHGPAKHRPQFEQLQRSYLLVPQCPSGSWWRTKALMNLIQEVLKRPDVAVDRSRIYLTGLSMGGYASWKLLSEHPKFFAAIVPVCGGGDFSSLKINVDVDRAPSFSKERLGQAIDTPVWAFHGELDRAVPFTQSVELTQLLMNKGNRNVKLTRYPTIGHNAWDPAYSDEALYSWLFSQHRRTKN